MKETWCSEIQRQKGCKFSLSYQRHRVGSELCHSRDYSWCWFCLWDSQLDCRRQKCILEPHLGSHCIFVATLTVAQVSVGDLCFIPTGRRILRLVSTTLGVVLNPGYLTSTLGDLHILAERSVFCKYVGRATILIASYVDNMASRR